MTNTDTIGWSSGGLADPIVSRDEQELCPRPRPRLWYARLPAGQGLRRIRSGIPARYQD